MLDLFRVVVEDADQEESQHDEEEEVDADEHPDEVFEECWAAAPAQPVLDEVRFAELFRTLCHPIGDKAVPEGVNEEQNESNTVCHIEWFPRLIVMPAEKGRTEPDGEDRVDHDVEDVHTTNCEHQIEQTEHKDDDEADDERATAATLVFYLLVFENAHNTT